MRFKPGQKVVCIADGTKWVKVITIDELSFWDRLKLMFRGNKVLGPKYNEVVTVARVKQNPGFIPLIEYNVSAFGQYDEKCFEPLVADSVLEAELESIEYTNMN